MVDLQHGNVEHAALPTAKDLLLRPRDAMTWQQSALSYLSVGPRASQWMKGVGAFGTFVGGTSGPAVLGISFAKFFPPSDRAWATPLGGSLLTMGISGALVLGTGFAARSKVVQAAARKDVLLKAVACVDAHPAAVKLLSNLLNQHTENGSAEANRRTLCNHPEVLNELPGLSSRDGNEALAALRTLTANAPISTELSLWYLDTHFAVRREAGWLLKSLSGEGLSGTRAAELSDEHLALANELMNLVSPNHYGGFWYLQRLAATDRTIDWMAGEASAAGQLLKAVLQDAGVPSEQLAPLVERARQIPVDLDRDKSPLHRVVHHLLHLDGPGGVAFNRTVLQSHLPLGALADLAAGDANVSYWAFVELAGNAQLGTALRIAERPTLPPQTIEHAAGLVRDLWGQGLSSRAVELSDTGLQMAARLLGSLSLAPFWWSVVRRDVANGRPIDLHADGSSPARALLRAVLVDIGVTDQLAQALAERAGQGLQNVRPEDGRVQETLHALLNIAGPDRVQHYRDILETHSAALPLLRNLVGDVVFDAAHALGKLSNAGDLTKPFESARPPALVTDKQVLIESMTLADRFIWSQDDQESKDAEEAIADQPLVDKAIRDGTPLDPQVQARVDARAERKALMLDETKYKDATRMLAHFPNTHAPFWYERRLEALGRQVPEFDPDPKVQVRNIVRAVLEEAGAEGRVLTSAMDKILWLQQHPDPDD